MVLKIIFWASLFLIFYTYLGYHIVLLILARFFSKPCKKKAKMVLPMVSVVIAARNEERNIGERIINILQQDYPENKIELIVVSDSSSDGTDAIVESFVLKYSGGKQVVKLVKPAHGTGKPNAINAGVSCSVGEIIIFTDVRQHFASDAILQLVNNYQDPQVGCVSGELFFRENSDNASVASAMDVYWGIEKAIRKAESVISSTVGATGAIYSIRRSLFKKLPEDLLLDDVLTPMNVIMAGYRGVFEAQAKAYDESPQDLNHEWRRKVRTLGGIWQLLLLCPKLFLPWENPIWWQFVSHKFCRVIVPFFLIFVLVSNIFIGGEFYKLFLMIQLSFYSIASVGFFYPGSRGILLVNLSFFWVTLNHAAIIGLWAIITNKTKELWIS